MLRLWAVGKRQRHTGEFPGAETVTNSELLTLPCDVFVPAAMEGQITEHNAPHLRTSMI